MESDRKHTNAHVFTSVILVGQDCFYTKTYVHVQAKQNRFLSLLWVAVDEINENFRLANVAITSLAGTAPAVT